MRQTNVFYEQLTCRTFFQNYKFWYLHCEGPSVIESMTASSTHVVEDFIEPQNPMEDMLNDAFGFVRHDVNDFDEDDGLQNNMGGDEVITNFDVLLKDNNEPLYECCRKYSKLSFMLKLYHIKCMYRMSDNNNHYCRLAQECI